MRRIPKEKKLQMLIIIFNVVYVRKIFNHQYPMQTEKSQSAGQRIMPETRKTSFPTLSVFPRVWISGSASETDDRFYLSHFSDTYGNYFRGFTVLVFCPACYQDLPSNDE